jgi:phosphoglycerol transferase
LDGPSPSTTEPGQTLGLVGAAGFIGLLAMAVTPLVGGRGLRDPNDRALALFGVTSLVLGAGGGAVLAIAGLTEIRAWNRISIFIAFVGVAAAARALDRLLDRRTRSAPVVLAVVVLGTTVAVLDQSSGADTPHYDTVNAEFSTERDFVREIERAVGPTAAVLQLPHTRYPEEGPQASMDDYSHMKGWLHSDTLRWSYGVVRGRPSWQDGQRGLSMPDQLRRARVAGFTAVWVDRFAYVDAGALVQHVLQDCLGNPIVIERGGRRVLYDLRTDPTC